jgi:membrane protein
VSTSERISRVWKTLRCAARASREHQLTTTAQALAYSLFLAIPSTLLVLLGVFSLVADPDDVRRLVERLESVMPTEAADLVGQSLDRTVASARSGIVMTSVGLTLAVWSTTSAATSLMNGIGTAFDCPDERGFVRRRVLALAIVVCLVVAALLVVGLLVLGPHLAGWVADASGQQTLTEWLWWTLQWPILLAALLFAFAVALYLGPDVEQPRLQLMSPGAVVALVVWLAASGALAFYSAHFGSFEKTWGTLSAVVVTLLWLWLGSAALLFGAEVNAQVRRPGNDVPVRPPDADGRHLHG